MKKLDENELKEVSGGKSLISNIFAKKKIVKNNTTTLEYNKNNTTAKTGTLELNKTSDLDDAVLLGGDPTGNGPVNI